MDREINTGNLKLHCRTCLNLIKGNKYKIKELLLSVFQNFQECTEHLESESYPDSLCFRCYWRLKSYDEFRKQCQKSNLFLKNLFKSQPEEIFVKSGNAVGIEDEKPSGKYEQQSEIALQEEETSDNFELEDALFVEDSVDEDHFIKKSMNSNYLCQECLCSFSCASALKLHKRIHMRERPFQCEQCDRGFNNKSRLNRHTREVHDNPQIIECKFGCGKAFKFAETATAHYRRKHKDEGRTSDNEHTSDTESKYSKQSNDLQANLETNTLGEETDEKQDNSGIKDSFPKYISRSTCRICFMQCASIQTLRKHLLQHTNTKQFECDKCDKAFHVKGMLALHEKEVHGDAPVEIPCKYGCGKVFRRSGTAMTHYRVIHKGLKRIHKSCVCEDCGKVCTNISFLKEHRYQHVPLEETPYKCDPCKRNFRSKKALNVHNERHHEAMKKYQCPHCGVRKATRRDLNLHVNAHTKEKKYPCPTCSKVFFNSENLRRHKLTVHLGIKKYKCRHCDESFTKSNERTEHENQH